MKEVSQMFKVIIKVNNRKRSARDGLYVVLHV